MKNTIKLFGIITMVAVASFFMWGCASGPPPQEQIQELRQHNDGSYRLDINTRSTSHQWFVVQPSVSGDMHVRVAPGLPPVM